MSKSTPTSHPHAGEPGTRATAQSAAPGDGTEPAASGIDYGPALAAVHDLAAWAIDLAARDVADWPEGKRRVDSARQFVLARLRGKHPRSVPAEDVVFTAGLLARIFEADLRLPMTDMVSIFDRLGFPTDVVPLRLCPASSASRPQDPPGSPITPITPSPEAVATAPGPVDTCNGCGQRVPRAA